MTPAAKVLTVSDSVAHGHTIDRSGLALAQLLRDARFEVVSHDVCEDGIEPVAKALHTLAQGFIGLIVTTGGTGFGARDLTPEGTRMVIEREAPGIAEAMRLVNPLGRLSRAISGTYGQVLIVNTPGSPRGAIECLGAIIDIVPHALELLGGKNPHPQNKT